MKAADQRRLTPMLSAAMGIFAVMFCTLWLGMGNGVHWSPAPVAAPLPPAQAKQSLPPPAPLDPFALVWQKPLFSPNRLPVARRAADGALDDLQLTGVIISRGVRLVMAQNKAHDRDLLLRQGKATPDGQWTLLEVRPRSALFDSPNGRVEMKLPTPGPAPNPKSGNAAPPTPGAAQVIRIAGRDRARSVPIETPRTERADSTRQGVR